jgi:hypothetical protein
LIPAGDTVKTISTDTFTVKSYTYDDGIYWISGVNRLLVGSYLDPIFGQTSASFALQFIPSSLDSFPSNSTADSILLYLPIDTVAFTYGDSTVQKHIDVYRITQRNYYNANYNSVKDPDIMYSELLSSKSYIPQNIKVETLTTGRTTSNIKRVSVKLPISLAQGIMALNDSIYLSAYDYIYFPDYFKGIFVKSTNTLSNESVSRFLINDQTKIRIYYRYPGLTTDTSFDFTANSTLTAKLNFYKHNYAGTNFYSNLSQDNVEQDSVAYIQSGGVKTKIVLPNINALKGNSKMSILRAQLIIKTAELPIVEKSKYPPLKNLYLFAINSDGTTSVMPDYMATYDTKNKEYRFDMANYIQDISLGKITDYGFYLLAYNEKSIYGRSVITTSRNSNPMKLIVTYNKLN